MCECVILGPRANDILCMKPVPQATHSFASFSGYQKVKRNKTIGGLRPKEASAVRAKLNMESLRSKDDSAVPSNSAVASNSAVSSAVRSSVPSLVKKSDSIASVKDNWFIRQDSRRKKEEVIEEEPVMVLPLKPKKKSWLQQLGSLICPFSGEKEESALQKVRHVIYICMCTHLCA